MKIHFFEALHDTTKKWPFLRNSAKFAFLGIASNRFVSTHWFESDRIETKRLLYSSCWEFD